jgi:hypothetical protein
MQLLPLFVSSEYLSQIDSSGTGRRLALIGGTPPQNPRTAAWDARGLTAFAQE